MGERPEEAGAAGALILSGVGAGEGVGRERAPLFRPGRGNRERGEGGEVGWAGVGGAGVRPSLGRGGSVQMGHGSSGGGRPAPFFSFPALFLFSVFFLFACFLFCYISFKVFAFYKKEFSPP